MPADKKAKTKKVSNTKKSTAKLEQKKSGFRTEVFFLLAFGILILLILSNFGLAGVVGVGIKWLEFGLIGVMGYAIPFLFAGNLIYLSVNRPLSKDVKWKFITAYISIVLLSAFIQRIYDVPRMEYYNVIDIFFYSADYSSGGGILGALICFGLSPLGMIASVVILVILLTICVMYLFNWSIFKTFKYIFSNIRANDSVRKSKKAAKTVNAADVAVADYQNPDVHNQMVNEQAGQGSENIIKGNDISNNTINNKTAEDNIVKGGKTADSDRFSDGKNSSDSVNRDENTWKVDDDMANIRDAYSKNSNSNPERNPKKNLRMENKSAGTGFNVFSIKEASHESTNKGNDVETIEITNMFPKSTSDEKREFSENTFRDVVVDEGDSFKKYPNRNRVPDSNVVVSDDLVTTRDEVSAAEHNDFHGSGISSFENGADNYGGLNNNPGMSHGGSDISRNVNGGRYDNGNAIANGDADANANAVNQATGANSFDAGAVAGMASGAATGSVATGMPDNGVQNGMQNSMANGMNIAAGSDTSSDYVFPPISLLNEPKNYDLGDINMENQEMADNLCKILEIFGVKVKITGISVGPTVTRFEMQPEIGTKVSKVVNLKDEIKMGLAVSDIRIQAPIPGKSAIGIEIPNKKPRSVSFRELIESKHFRESKSKVSFAVGEDIGGNVVVGDIADMPHVIIAGSTGSGKSVCINALIMSVLYKATPDDVKMIMVDPKVVELSIYNGIPHLLVPVVSDPKKAASALNWAVAEMDKRYNKLAELGSRNIKEYNNKILSGEFGENHTKMPQILVIIDELADLMMVAKNEVEAAIVRLAQKARAAGIHLIIATQRPSADVITGLIKANIPSKIAFAVSNGSNSRIILDENGAENLLGKGDMLYAPRNEKPKRVQGAFVSDDEVSRVVEFLKEHSDGTQINEDISRDMESEVLNASIPIPGAEDEDSLDSLFEDAGRFVIEREKASIGMLQRNFRIGFNRAGRIIDQLSEAGVVGPDIGTKPRKVLITMQEFDELLSKFR